MLNYIESYIMSLLNKKNAISSVLAVLLFLAMLNSAFFFISALGFGPGQWLAFNACSVAIIAHVVCFAAYLRTKNAFWLAIPLLPMYYYGTMGLFLMEWSANNAFAHITHVLITINVVWILYTFIKERDYSALGRGLLAGMIIFVPIFAIIQTYNQAHINEFIQALQKL